MSLLQQAQNEGLCLQYPEPLGQHREITLETAVNTLAKAPGMANNMAFHWRYIDKPNEGQLAMLFLPPQTPFPNDGIRWLETESTQFMNVGGGRELEVSEIKSGFIPGSQDQTAWRLRRRYRLLKGGHPNFVLVHYTRGPSTPIVPSLANQPVRAYPLRTVAEPPTIVLGDKAGQKVFTSGPGGPSMQAPPPGSVPPVMPGGPVGMANMGFNRAASQVDMINHQNQAHEQLERRRRMEMEKERQAAAAAARERGGSTAGPHPHPSHPPHIQQPYNYDDDDDLDSISTRSLALTRYKRNHDLMNEVFRQAAFGDKSRPQQPSPYSIFDKEDLERRTAKLEEEIEQMKQKAAERREKKLQGSPDIAMQDPGQLLTA